jgi:hypothetical protein
MWLRSKVNDTREEKRRKKRKECKYSCEWQDTMQKIRYA